MSTATVTSTPPSTPPMRTIVYTYEGLQRLLGSAESPGSSYSYQYDLAGNRTDVTTNGTPTQHRAYDAADRVQDWTYDAAGNLLTDGTATNTYDSLGRLTGATVGAQAATPQLQRRRHPGRSNDGRHRHRVRPGPGGGQRVPPCGW